VNKNEQVAYDAMVKKGWTVLRNGWPDFLVLNHKTIRVPRIEQYGGTEYHLPDVEKVVIEGCGIEFKAKTTNDKLRPEQIAMHEGMKALGIPVHVLTNGSPSAIKSVERRFFYPRPLELMKQEATALREELQKIEKRIHEYDQELNDASVLFEPEPEGSRLFGVEPEEERVERENQRLIAAHIERAFAPRKDESNV